MMKIRKLAFDQSNSGPTAADTAKTLALTGALSELGNQALRAYDATTNALTSQATPIGELFADFANAKLKDSAKGSTAVYIPTHPRVAGKPGSLWNYLSPIPSFMDTFVGGGTYDAESVQDIVTELKDHMSRELSGSIPPDKIMKAEAQGIDSVSSMIKKWELDNIKHRVTAPRNNLAVLAHEYGHAVGMGEMGDTVGQPARNLMKSIGRKVWSGLGESMSSSLPEIPGVNKVFDAFLDKLDSSKIPPLAKNYIMQFGFAPSIPMWAAGAVAASENIRKGLKALSPFESVDNAIDWVGDNPGTSVAIATAPYIANEAFTLAPGGKMLNEFFSELRKGGGSLAGNPLLKDVLSGIKPMDGTKAILKFLAHTAASTAAGAALPLSFIAAKYLMDRSNSNE